MVSNVQTAPDIAGEEMLGLQEMARLLGCSDDTALAWLDRQHVPRYDLNSQNGRPLAKKAAVRVKRRDFFEARERCRVAAPAGSDDATEPQPLKRKAGYVPRHFDPAGKLIERIPSRRQPSSDSR